jgi:hypothetical protein
MNPVKTHAGQLVSAKDCMTECAYKQMLLTKLDYKQSTGRQYVHMIQSFSVADEMTSEIAHEIGQKLLAHFEGFQGIVATHTDRKHLHNHIVLNSVNWNNGYKWQQTPRDLQQLKVFSDELCKEYGLSVVSNNRAIGWKSYGENRALHENKCWKANLAKDIAESISKSANREDFVHYLNKHNIDADFRTNNIIFTLCNGLKCSNGKLMAYGDFSLENIKQHLNFRSTALSNGLQDAGVLYEAYQLAGSLLKPQNPDYIVQKFARGDELSGLEGQELINAILAIKEKQYREKIRQQNENTLSEEQHPNYYLMTIADLLEIALEEEKQTDFERNKYIRNISNENEEEWDFEL